MKDIAKEWDMGTYYQTNGNVTEWNPVCNVGTVTGKTLQTFLDEQEELEQKRELARRKRKRMLREQRRKRRKIRRLIQAGIRLGIFLIIVTAGFSFLMKKIGGVFEREGKIAEPYYHESTGISAEDVRKQDIYQYVLEHPELYPENMAEKLEKNPELMDFVEHYLEYDPVARGGISKSEKEQRCPLFLQWDERWGYASYGDDNIGFSGCGPACLSMVIYSLTRDESATPDAIGKYAMEQDYYMSGVGTSWELMTAAPLVWNVNVSTLGMDENIMKDSLDCGQLIIASMGPGDFTSSGHFIVLYGYNEDGFFVNDPNSKKRSNQVWDFDTLFGQVRNLWVYYN